MSKGRLITPPEGYKFDEDAWSNDKIEFIKIDELDELPESWDELKILSGWYIDDYSSIQGSGGCVGDPDNRNIAPTKPLAEAVLALIQLLQLRDRYNGGCIINWKDGCVKYSILSDSGLIVMSNAYSISHVLTFKSEKLRDKFYDAPKIMELMVIARPFL